MSIQISKKLEYWEHQLLDLGKRNRMINYRERGRSTLRLTEPALGDLYRRLACNEETLTFRRPIDRETDVRVYSILSLMESLSSPLQVLIGDIGAAGSIQEQRRTLKNLRAKTRLAQEEQGTHILYLSFGFIEWREGKGSGAQWIKSPLILVPAVLALDALNAPYTLKKHEDDIVINPTLEYYLKTEYGIELPPFDPDEDSPEDYFAKLEEIADKRGWRILREVSLGLLSFLKISMYNDLLRNRQRMEANPVIRAMAGDPAAVNEIPEQLSGHERRFQPAGCHFVLPPRRQLRDAGTSRHRQKSDHHQYHCRGAGSRQKGAVRIGKNGSAAGGLPPSGGGLPGRFLPAAAQLQGE